MTYKAKPPGSLHEAFDRFFDQVGIKAAAAFEGIRPEAIYKGLDADQVGDFRFSRIARLTEHFRCLTLAEYLAWRGGGIVFPLRQVEEHGGSVGRVSGAAMREVADVFTALGEALEDGTITQAEYARLDREIHEAIGKLLLLLNVVRAEAERNDG